jgi:hypothetical protein
LKLPLKNKIKRENKRKKLEIQEKSSSKRHFSPRTAFENIGKKYKRQILFDKSSVFCKVL